MGDLGESCRLLIGNPQGTDIEVRLAYGPTTSVPEQTIIVMPQGVFALNISKSKSNLFICSEAPVVVQLVIYTGMLNEAILLPV